MLMQSLSFEQRYQVLCGDGLPNVTVRPDANAPEPHHVELGQQTGGTKIEHPQIVAEDVRPMMESRISDGADSERSTAIPQSNDTLECVVKPGEIVDEEPDDDRVPTLQELRDGTVQDDSGTDTHDVVRQTHRELVRNVPMVQEPCPDPMLRTRLNEDPVQSRSRPSNGSSAPEYAHAPVEEEIVEGTNEGKVVEGTNAVHVVEGTNAAHVVERTNAALPREPSASTTHDWGGRNEQVEEERMLERVMIVGGTGGGDRVAAGALDVEANDDGHVKMTRDVCMQKHEVLVKRAVLMKHEVMIIPECSMEHAVFMKHEVLKIPECSMVLEILGAIAYRFSVTPSRTPMLDWGEDWLASSSSRQLNALSFHVCAMPESIYRCYSRPFLFVFSP